MSDKEFVEPRHATRGRDATRAAAVQAFTTRQRGVGLRPPHPDPQPSIGRRSWSARCPAVVLFRGLAPQDRPNPVALLSHTMWKKGTRLAQRPRGHADPRRRRHARLRIPRHPRRPANSSTRGLPRAEGQGHRPAHAPAARRPPRGAGRKDWSYDGIVAYSKICTHVGCPVALYEQQTHHLLCPCHQSQFDVTNERCGHLRPGQARPCRSCRSRSTPRATWSPGATSPNPSARASGSVIEYRLAPRA